MIVINVKKYKLTEIENDEVRLKKVSTNFPRKKFTKLVFSFTDYNRISKTINYFHIH